MKWFESKRSVYHTKMNIFPKAMFSVFSRNQPCKDSYVPGDYFVNESKNQYFGIVNKKTSVKNLKELTHFVPIHFLQEADYNPEQHAIVRLVFDTQKQYFVESNQAITAKNPDVCVIHDRTISELRNQVPSFVEIPP